MKKKTNRYKKDNSFTQIISKYKILYFFGFMGMFLILSVILGISAFATISNNYLLSTKTVIMEFVEKLDQCRQGTGPGVISGWPNDPRMVVTYYYLSDDEPPEILGINDKDKIDTYNAYVTESKTISDLGKFKIVKINNYANLCYSVELTPINGVYLRMNNKSIAYVKIYMNVEGEISSRKQFMSAYIICACLMFLLSSIAGVIMSKQGMKPLKDFVQKQIDFVSDASHELRTPLAIVQSKIENTLANPEKTIYEVSEALAIALNEINRLNKLTSELLTLARNDKDNIVLNLENVEMNQVIKDIINPFVEIAIIQNRSLTYSGIDCYARIDLDKLKQILIIIIDNALKYTNDGDSINVKLDVSNNEINIEIKDTGIGISDTTKSHIFERFYREDKARSRETGGNGLGLAIAHTLIHIQKGRITVDHNEPKGTKFNIYFPRIKQKNDCINNE